MNEPLKSLGIRITEKENQRLEELARTTNRSKTDMVRWLINQEYVRLTGEGSELLRRAVELTDASQNRPFLTCCPFHEDVVSTLMLTEKGYFCLRCGAKGTLEELINHLQS